MQGGFGCVWIRVSEVMAVYCSMSMSNSMICVRVPICVRGGLILGDVDVYAIRGGYNEFWQTHLCARWCRMRSDSCF